MNSKKSLLVFSLLITALIFTGCPYNSESPLSRPEKAGVDTSLLGTWLMKTSPDPSNSCRILQFNDHELLIIVKEGEKQDLYRAFTTKISGVKFLNVREIGQVRETDAASWVFVNYQSAGAELTFRFVEDTLPERDKLSSKAYVDLIRRDPKNRELFRAESDGVLIRVKE